MTGCDRILARLEQGPATAAELYATTYTVVHSRIADLRRRGYVIECEHVEGKGAASYLYTLCAGFPPANPLGSVGTGGSSELSPSPGSECPAQMSFSEAA